MDINNGTQFAIYSPIALEVSTRSLQNKVVLIKVDFQKHLIGTQDDADAEATPPCDIACSMTVVLPLPVGIFVVRIILMPRTT